MQQYSFNESENKTGYSLSLCLSLRQDNVIVLVRSKFRHSIVVL